MLSEHHFELLKKSNDLFDKTKKKMRKYKQERLNLLKFTESKKPNYEEWEKYIQYFENLIKHK